MLQDFVSVELMHIPQVYAEFKAYCQLGMVLPIHPVTWRPDLTQSEPYVRKYLPDIEKGHESMPTGANQPFLFSILGSKVSPVQSSPMNRYTLGCWDVVKIFIH